MSMPDGIPIYDRPDRQWRCGRLALGQPCPRGPNARGVCQGTADCAPARRGDRWSCTRAPSAGGPCAGGPHPDGSCASRRPPCVPVRSLSALRRRVTRLVVVAVIGLLLIALHGTERDALLIPGPLTFQHSAVGGCAECHQGFDDGPAGWVLAAFGAGDVLHGDQACHSCHALGPDAELAHSRPPAVTAALTRDAKVHQVRHHPRVPIEFKLSAWLFTEPEDATSAVGCATCHREHQGVDASLTHMPEGACQTCHVVRFSSLGDGHPEFGETLFDRRPRIAFDHAAHLDRHFSAPESTGKAPETCTSCHHPSEDGRFMRTNAFEDMCAACHLDDIAGSAAIGPKGIAFLTVPGLDTRELAARGVDIGDWPQWSEEPVTPFMRRMLATEAGVTAALARLDGLDPLDLRDAGAEDIRAAAKVALAVKRLTADLLADGVDAAQARLTMTGDDSVQATESTGTLLGHLPAEVLRAAARDWFPRLASEVSGALAPIPQTIPGPVPEQAAAAASPAGTDTADILAPPVDQSDILAPAPDQSDILAPPVDQSDILAPAPDQSDILAPPVDQSDIHAPAPDQSAILAPPVDQSDILAPAPDQSAILAPPTGDLAPAVDPSETLAPVPDSAPTPPIAVEDAADPPPTEITPDVSPEDWMRAGGWYRGEFALLYRPTGHTDSFMRAWLDIAAAGPSDDGLMRVFAAPQAPGTCLRCHSVDRPEEGGTGGVNWFPAAYDPETREFVRFAHEPHFSLVEKTGGCQTCHAVIRPSDGQAATAFQNQYSQRDPHAGVIAGFAPPSVETCSECHAPGRAGDDCTQCHAYHVGRFESPTVPTRMEVSVPRDP